RDRRLRTRLRRRIDDLQLALGDGAPAPRSRRCALPCERLRLVRLAPHAAARLRARRPGSRPLRAMALAVDRLRRPAALLPPDARPDLAALADRRRRPGVRARGGR